jgi:SAM-dependent methyltransferase
MKLDNCEVAFHPLSEGADGTGRVFWWEGELYRAISNDHAAFYQHLLSDGILHSLARRNLVIDTEPTNLELDGYPLVLKQRTVPFVSYYYEWCGEMLKAAALSVLELEKELENNGLALVDPNPWNILFAGTTPLWVDLGSIRPARFGDPQRAYEDFSAFYTRPLRIMAAGFEHVARCLLRDGFRGVDQREVAALTEIDSAKMIQAAKQGAKSVARRVVPSTLRPFVRRAAHHRPKPACDAMGTIERAAHDLDKINLVQRPTSWSGYYLDSEFPDFISTVGWTEKMHSILRILSAKKPASVLDLGSNRGWYSQLAARNGAHVVTLDSDETSVTNLYFDAVREQLSILPLVGDFCHLSPTMAGRGVAPAERLRCDMVMALAIVHHLVRSLSLPFEVIIRDIAALTGKWLVIEFVGREDIHNRDAIKAHWYFSRYTLDNFLVALKREFHKIDIFPSDAEHRRILLCER